MSNTDPNQPHLKRVLGRFDLVLLFVVAVFNLNVVPSIAANGGVTVWLWMISLLLFFWPQGIAVIELAHRYPGRRRRVLVGERSVRRLPRISIRLVLLDE
jgi:amino acid transporter